MKKIKVLIVDDSVLIQSVLSEVLAQYQDIEVVGVAQDPYDAREKIKSLRPDVITLDIEMPRMDGITFLRNLMRLRPMPVIMISTLTEAGAPATLEALEVGAVDFIPKPKINVAKAMVNYGDELHLKICTAATSAPRAMSSQRVQAQSSIRVNSPDQVRFKQNHIVAIGASTGGTEAIKEVITRLPANFPPVVVAQHIPPAFSTSFAKRMDSVCKMKVYEATQDQVIENGCVYIAPGDFHLRIKKVGRKYMCQLSSEEPVNRHRPSVEVLLNSVADSAGKHATGIMLTGMGADGALGLLNMRNAGCNTLAQDRQTCVVWGMPKAAVEVNAVEKVAPLHDIADIAMQLTIKT